MLYTEFVVTLCSVFPQNSITAAFNAASNYADTFEPHREFYRENESLDLDGLKALEHGKLTVTALCWHLIWFLSEISVCTHYFCSWYGIIIFCLNSWYNDQGYFPFHINAISEYKIKNAL